MAKEASKGSDAGVITLDVSSLLIPGSILLGAVIIAISLLVTRGEGSFLDNDDSGNRDTVVADNDDGGSDNNYPNPTAAPTTVTVSVDDDPWQGSEDAEVVIIEFSDYECPFCQRHHTETSPSIVENFVDSGDVAVVFRDYPLSFHDPLATEQAQAAECVQEFAGDDVYFEYKNLLFTETGVNGSSMSDADLEQIISLGGQVGVDEGELADCIESDRYLEEVQADLADGSAAGITGTPGFIVGTIDDDGNVTGEIVSGAQLSLIHI